MTTKAKRRRNRPAKSILNATKTTSDGTVGVFTSTAPEATQLKTVDELHAWLKSKGDNRGGLDIRGRVVAQLGVFKDRRGEFAMDSLEAVRDLGNNAPKGLKSYFKHESLSDDNLGRLLGRDTEFYLDESGEIPKVRSSHFVLSSVAMKPSPDGGGTPYGEYVAELAISDPSAFSSSLTLNYKPRHYYDDAGQREREPDGNLKPPVWIPTKLSSIDVVSTGDAVDDFLGFEDGDEKLIVQAATLCERFFDRGEVTPKAMLSRLTSFAQRVTDNYFEGKMGTESKTDDQALEELQAKLDAAEKQNEQLAARLDKLEQGSKVTPPEVSPEPDSEMAKLQKRIDDLERLQTDKDKIMALCKHQGKSELATDFIEQKLSVDQVKDKLLEINANDRKLDDNPDGGQGGRLRPEPSDLSKLSEEKLEVALLEEYNEDAKTHEKLGLTFEEYKEDRMIELGRKSESSSLLGKFSNVIGMFLLCLVGSLTAIFGFGQDPSLVLGFVGLGMAVTANQMAGRDGKGRRVRRKMKGNQVIYDRTITFLLADGYLSATYAASSVFGGVAFEYADSTGESDGVLATETIMDGLIEFFGITHSLVQGDVGSKVYATDNHTLTTTSTNAVEVGTLQDITEKGNPLVSLKDFQ